MRRSGSLRTQFLSGDAMRPPHWAILALLMIGGGALRVAGADSAPLWVDEALTTVISRSGFGDLFLGGIDPTGGLYYALHKLLVPAGAGPEGQRAIALVCGTFLIPMLFAAVRAFAGTRAGLGAAALAAIFPPLVDYSREARAYALLLLLIAVSAWGLIEWGRRKEQRYLLLFAGAALLALYTHPTAIAWLCPAALWLVHCAIQGGQRRSVYPTLAAMALAAMPEFLRIFRYATQGGTFSWLEQQSLFGAAGILAHAILPLGWNGLVPGLGWAAALAVAAWVAFRLRQSGDSVRAWLRENSTAAVVIAILLSVPVSLWILGFIGPPILMLRTALPAAIGATMLFALLATIGQAPRAGSVQLSLLAALYGGSLFAGGSTRPAEPWDRVATFLASQSRGGDVIIVCPYWAAPALYAAFDQAHSPPEFRLLVMHDNRIQRLADVGSPSWIESFHRDIFSADWPRARIEERRPLRSAMAIRRFWWVDKGCGGAERQAIARWASGGTWRDIAIFPAPHSQPDIRIELFTPQQPVRTWAWISTPETALR